MKRFLWTFEIPMRAGASISDMTDWMRSMITGCTEMREDNPVRLEDIDPVTVRCTAGEAIDD